jgi:hypothetical protein
MYQGTNVLEGTRSTRALTFEKVLEEEEEEEDLFVFNDTIRSSRALTCAKVLDVLGHILLHL